MTSFGTFLGKENGKTMLTEVFKDCTVEQARSAVTTYCMIFGIEVDSKEWDELIRWIDENYNSWFNSRDELDDYLCVNLV